MRVMLFFLIMLYSFNCNEHSKNFAKSEIFPIAPFSHTDTVMVNNENQEIKIEFYVVTNPPQDTLELKKEIESFNQKTLSGDEKGFDRFQRVFYKESKATTRTYVETDADNIETHLKDIIAEIHWIDHDRIKYFQFFKDGKAITKLKDVNLD
jgi:hypothetical protein